MLYIPVARKCNRCNHIVFKSDVKGYPYVCLVCDENLYRFETYKYWSLASFKTEHNIR